MATSGSLLEGSGSLFGASWPAFERFGTLLDSSWKLRGRLWGPSWPLLGVSWLVWAAACVDFGSQASILEGLVACQAGFCKVSGSCFDIAFAVPFTLLHNVFIDAVAATLLHSPALFLLPFRCGGLCTAHGI